jgi:hypothetical protein
MNLLNNERMNILAGASWAKQFVFTRTLPGNQVEWVGRTGWGAEFGLVNPDNPSEIYSVATVANNKAAWVADGILWVSFSQAETVTFNWSRAAWYLDLVVPNTSVDPFGFRDTVLRGILRCEPRSPTQPTIFPSSRV